MHPILDAHAVIAKIKQKMYKKKCNTLRKVAAQIKTPSSEKKMQHELFLRQVKAAENVIGNYLISISRCFCNCSNVIAVLRDSSCVFMGVISF